jgi:hypothetical protein
MVERMHIHDIILSEYGGRPGDILRHLPEGLPNPLLGGLLIGRGRGRGLHFGEIELFVDPPYFLFIVLEKRLEDSVAVGLVELGEFKEHADWHGGHAGHQSGIEAGDQPREELVLREEFVVA